jgi:hypothetical protein
MSTRALPQVLPRPHERSAVPPAIGRIVLKVLVIALIAVVVVAVRYLLFAYAQGGRP